VLVALLGFFEVDFPERPPGGLVDQEAHFATGTSSRRPRLTFTADQSDHCPHSQANLIGNAAYAEPFGAQCQRCFDFPRMALLDGASSELLPVGASTS
jgi:hypothetical protein